MKTDGSPSAHRASPIRLIVTAGPHAGKEYAFDRHDTFLVGRSKDAHFQLSYDDPYFSRRQFLVEVNPPRVRVLDLESRNGTLVNGRKVEAAELRHGDEIRAGKTVFRVEVPTATPGPDDLETLANPDAGAAGDARTADFPESGAGRIPGYELRGVLGSGGMGTVYLAVSAADGREVAVKVIRPAAGTAGRQVERFLRESRVLAGLEHRNIVGYLESGRADPLVYLVMERVDGPDAGRFLDRSGPLPVAGAVRIACGLLAGLAHAHARGFVHRDVKPSNVLIGGGPGVAKTVKVADFGLARAYDDCKLSGLTMQGEVGGTPAFMAPEQVTHYRDVRPAADQYSAAATLYRLLTGRTPHDLPKDVGQQLAHIVSRPPVPIGERRPGLPAGLVEAIERALDPEPADRFADVTAFRSALLPFAS